MKKETLFDAVGAVDDALAAESIRPARRKKAWLRWGALAACLALVVAAGGGALRYFNFGGNAGGSGANAPGAAMSFQSYAGPVLPLTLREPDGDITAARTITLDFAPWVKQWRDNEAEAAEAEGLTEEERQVMLAQYEEWFPEGGYFTWSDDILVTDSYTLTNHSDADRTVRVLYPFAGSLQELGERLPTLTLDGAELAPLALHAGKYTGGFTGAWGSAEAGASLNLDSADWTGYQAALSGGDYLESALSGWPDLSGVAVTVYRFTNPAALEEGENPSIRAKFSLDYEKTAVLSYGFSSGRFDREAGTMERGYGIPKAGWADYGEPCYLIVIGEDVTDFSVAGYGSGGPEAEDAIGFDVTVTRYETDLDSVLREITENYMFTDRYERLAAGAENYELWYGAFCDCLTAYGPLSGSGVQRYDTGMLGDLNFDVMERVFYLEAELTIPAGGSVELAAAMRRPASYDYTCANTDKKGLRGYDLATALGSVLTCTEQTAVLEDRGRIEIVEQNFGFDLEAGVRSVALDPAQEHYYLLVREKKE